MTAPARLPADQAAQVLQNVLQQLPDSWTIRTLCSLTRVSTASRIAVLTAGVSCMVTASQQLCAAGVQQLSMAKFVGFCAWLPGHAGLVAGIDLDDMPKDLAAEQLLACTLQLCAQQTTALPPTAALGPCSTLAAAPTTPTGLARPLQQLQLRTFTVAPMPPPATLEALSSISSLTTLKIRGLSPEEPSSADCCSLSRLTGLRCLHLCHNSRTSMVPAHIGEALSGLRALQQLLCSGHVQPRTLLQLPAQLRTLDVSVRLAQPAAAAAEGVDLSHLTQLTGLVMHVFDAAEVFMPESIMKMALVAKGHMGTWPALSLPHITDFFPSYRTWDELGQQLAAMPGLQVLVVQGRRMPQVTPQVSASLSVALAAAMQLTRLRIERFHWKDKMTAPLTIDDSILLCESLRQLPGLCDLTVSCFKLQPTDVLQWTTISLLTALTVKHCSSMGDTAAAALACKLTGLKKLELRKCGLQSPVLWPAFAACSGLHSLCLAGNQLSVKFDTLMLLTSLNQLTRLDLKDLPDGITQDESDMFVQAFAALDVSCFTVTTL